MGLIQSGISDIGKPLVGHSRQAKAAYSAIRAAAWHSVPPVDVIGISDGALMKPRAVAAFIR
jgi:hypothetical protein